MDFLDALRVLKRRYLVVILGAAVTSAAGLFILKGVDTEYQAQAQYVVLLPAESGGEGRGAINPYLNLNGGLIFAASLIASDMSTAESERSLVEDGFESDYSVAMDAGGRPLIQVLVDGTDPDDVLETRDELLRRFDTKLRLLQELPEVPAEQLMFSTTNAVDPAPEPVPGSKTRALLLVAILGVVTTLVIAFLMDGLIRPGVGKRRRESR